MPGHRHVHGRMKMRRLKKSTKFWIFTGVFLIVFFLGLYVWSVVETGNLQDVPMPELGF